VSAHAHAIRAVGHKRKKRKRSSDRPFVSPLEFVQAELTRIFPRELPPIENIDLRRLTRRVQAGLKRNPDWLQLYGEEATVSRSTVYRALQNLRQL